VGRETRREKREERHTVCCVCGPMNAKVTTSMLGGKREKKREEREEKRREETLIHIYGVCGLCCVLYAARAVWHVLLLTQTSLAACFLVIATPFVVHNITLPIKSKDIHSMAEHIVQYHDNWNETT
jgi:hypothetical protein